MVDTYALGAYIFGCVGSSPTWGTMERIIVRYKDNSLKVNVSKDNTCILDSYTVKGIEDMKGILTEIRHEVSENDMAIHNRSIFSMINEWRVHNLLYSLNIQRNRTRSVNLNTGQPWYVVALYTILSPFYLHFS